jgi:hypothetical protein
MQTALAPSLLLVSAMAFAGCAQHVIMVKNPETGQVIVCQRAPFGPYNAAKNCADVLKKQGWIELGRD